MYDASVQAEPADAAADAAPVALTADAIRVRAYELYLARGDAPGDAVQDWLAAERALLGRDRGGDRGGDGRADQRLT